ncbi:MAG: 3-deoxy-D-manno-octulosonic acid transferase, partial [Bacteroidetes bacterium]|nr:3-deoxy-D-manno-octulosonic acid transferase [Bacteroidota bacterium]
IKILLTFFSPSGYEIRKDYDKADYVFYLPWDSPRQARWFAQMVKPQLAIFVKYEFWYHYSRELKRNNIPLLSISAIFREDQIFFRRFGGFFRSILKNVDHFFVQNTASAALLNSIGIQNVTVAGDTRFDRVNQIVKQGDDIEVAAEFACDKPVMVIGSAWPEDMEVLFPLINSRREGYRFIIAPHEITESFLANIESSLSVKVARYSRTTPQEAREADVLIIDVIGILSRLYRYGKFAFIGGGFRQGLHNILEAACYGLPVFFGNRAYQKFDEAVQLINLKGAFPVGNYSELQQQFDDLLKHPESYQKAADITRLYVEQNLGATGKIVSYCNQILKP